MNGRLTLNARKIRRAARTTAKIEGTPERPRLAVHRSNRFISAQLIDDQAGVTLAAASSKTLGVKGPKTEGAQAVGEAIAKRAKELGITKAVFDRRSFRYHGRVKQLAEAARSAGLEF